ncbi:lysyl oxidase family protein [Patulibacter sp.]|uniref:lysyl oxidase family protein n=1 Tax=Patulibacter sp. TaxID=1912859 RepID=UPI00271E884D|nr:lysyl oxidase family protein [Patulibacter sp.]MDO9409450.1 lysyl oxidase family protein [Patulibacter sp.]
MRRARTLSIAVLAAALVATGAGTVSAALGDGDERPSATATTRQSPVDPNNPCTAPDAGALRCPDLMMRRPFGLRTDRPGRGRVLLRAGNSIENVGAGPASLRGRRIVGGSKFMEADQLVRRADGGTRRIDTPGRLEYKYGHLNRRYWKFHDAARFELWALDAAGTKTAVVRTGPKVAYCLRDLERTRPGLSGTPRREVYPACSTDRDRRAVTLGTSVGWSDTYPPAYPEQWIDVTGLRGCFAYVHTADPGNALWESDEGNNVAQVVVRLPFRRTTPRGTCPGREFGQRYRKAGVATGAIDEAWYDKASAELAAGRGQR